jgi:hypothetical protein
MVDSVGFFLYSDSRKLASDFEVLSARLDSAMYQQSKHVWMTQMAEQH